MTEKIPSTKKGFSADWLVGGALTKIGDTLDRLTGRKWTPSSSIATSELIERIKKLLDAKAQQVPGKGTVVPHNIKLKVQWDKFSTDSEEAIERLENELLVATADHINDSLYYTYAPLTLNLKTDYFIEGVKLFVSFDKFNDEERDVEMNVTLPAINVSELVAGLTKEPSIAADIFLAKFEIKGTTREKRIEIPLTGSISVGRIGSNSFIIDDPSLSKIHASLSVDQESNLSVADTGSTNGTYINGHRIAYGKATRFDANDKVRFGMVEVTFEFIERQGGIGPDEAEVEENGDTVKIDGFEFKGRVSDDEPPVPQTRPAIEVELPAEETADETESKVDE